MSLQTPPNDNKDESAIVPSPGGSLKPLAHQEVRYKAAPTWTRTLQWAIVGRIDASEEKKQTNLKLR